MRHTSRTVALWLGGLTALALSGPTSTAKADYPPYTSASPPSDQFRITEVPASQQPPPQNPPQPTPPMLRTAQAQMPAWTSNPTPAPAPGQAQPPEVPWGQSSASGQPVMMGQQGLIPAAAQPAGTSSIISASPTPGSCESLIEATWYTRVDYFHWNERVQGTDFVNEDGVLNTLGYQYRYDHQRVRGEIFGGNVNYGAPMNFSFDPNDFLSSHTEYLGGRFEYEYVYDPQVFPSLSLFGGLGTRFWRRDLSNGATDNGYLIQGYTEDWWTLYPYMGLETRRTLEKDTELYGMGRIGVTAYTAESATVNDVVLHPRAGVTGQLEGGVRGKHLFVAAFFEAMGWSESAQELSGGFFWSQPKSTMYTIGMKAGANF